MKIINASFLKSSQSISDAPSPNVAEVAFLGRSNVGKSSLLNTLTRRKSLAKSSSTPGKTQLINHFEITFRLYNKENEEDKVKNQEKKIEDFYCRFVDLPGFGYAKVSKSIKNEWNKNLSNFLEKRVNLQIFVHLIDARHKNLEIDKKLDEYLEGIKRADQLILNVFTKIDKLKQNEIAQLKKECPNGIFISNLKKIGFESLEKRISEYLFAS